MKILREDTKLLYRLVLMFGIILVIGIISIRAMNNSGNQVAHNMQMLVEDQLPKLETIRALQTNIKKLELALYRYYETTDSDAYVVIWKNYRKNVTQLLSRLDQPFVTIFMDHLSALETLSDKFDAEMRFSQTDWNQLRLYLAESRQLSLEFEQLVDQKAIDIGKSFKGYSHNTENVISNLIITQVQFSIFTFVVILIVAFLLRKQLKHYYIQKELARYPEQNPQPILRLNMQGESLYLNPAAHQLAESLDLTALQLLPKACLTQVNSQANYQSDVYPLADRLFSAHFHHIEGNDSFYAYLIDVTEQAKAEQELLHRSTHDLLTGLPNRRQLEETLEQKTTSNTSSFGLLLFKASGLELINASLGHEMSDQLLVAMSERLSVFMQKNVSYEISLYAFEPGSWVILFQHDNVAEQAKQLGLDLLALFSPPIVINAGEFNTRGHIGITLYPNGGSTAKELLRNADAAMRQSLREGQMIRIYSEELTKQATHWLQLEQGIKQALNNDDFTLNIQPKVHASNGRFAGGEVLIRWQQNAQWVSPAEFIPIAEESGLIIAIGEWVLKTACQQWVSWTNQGLKPQRLAVNVSAQQFIQDEFVSLVAQTLETTGMVPAELELEITEEVAGQNPEKIISTMKALKGLGVRLTIDDFGTGYSSLSYLKRFPVDTLKIDRAFVSTMETDENNAAIVRMIMSLAKELKLEVVAEGVETQLQQQMLAELGCELIQGFYFYRPLNLIDYQAVFSA